MHILLEMRAVKFSENLFPHPYITNYFNGARELNAYRYISDAITDITALYRCSFVRGLARDSSFAR